MFMRVDNFSRVSPAIKVATSLMGWHAVEVIKGLKATRGMPPHHLCGRRRRVYQLTTRAVVGSVCRVQVYSATPNEIPLYDQPSPHMCA